MVPADCSQSNPSSKENRQEKDSRKNGAFRQKGKNVLKKLALLLGGTFLGLLIVEGGLRVTGITYPQIYFPDPHCGSRLQPDFEGWVTKEGQAYVKINSAGFRDREHSVEKPKGTLRIAVLGDSYVEALQVQREATFWSVMERELDDCANLGGRKVEVLAFGVSGYGTAQELLCLRHHVWQYDPDIVLLAFLAGNDIRNNCRKLEPQAVRPFYTLEDGRLVLDNSFREHPTYRYARSQEAQWKTALINRFYLLQVIQQFRQQRSQADKEKPDSPTETGLDNRCFVEATDPEWREAWKVTERLIETMHEEVTERNAQFQVALVSSGIQVHPDSEVRQEATERLGVANLFYPDQRIAELGQHEGFPVIELPRRMQRYAEKHNVFLHGFSNTKEGKGHWNEKGHRLAGEWIAEAICKGLKD